MEGMSPIHAVTTFSRANWEDYAERCLRSLAANLPRSVHLTAYHEGARGPGPSWWPAHWRWRELGPDPGRLRFLARHSNIPAHCGRRPAAERRDRWEEKELRAGYSYRWDAVRFCHKVFALRVALEEIQRGLNPSWLLWIDADVEAVAPLPEDALRTALGADAAVAGLPRPGKYIETGFVGYRLPDAAPLVRALAREYDSDAVFQRPEWHDAYVLDSLIAEGGYSVEDLAAGQSKKGDVFSRSALGRWLQHHKGPGRKARL